VRVRLVRMMGLTGSFIVSECPFVIIIPKQVRVASQNAPNFRLLRSKPRAGGIKATHFGKSVRA